MTRARSSLAVVVLVLGLTGACSGGQPSPAPASTAGPDQGLAAPRSAGFPVDSEPLRVLSHCTIRWTMWRGRSWAAENPQGAPTPPDNGSGVSVYDGYTSGTMTAAGPDLAVFNAPGLPEPVRFRPGPEPAGHCT